MLDNKIPEAFIFDYDNKTWEKFSAVDNKSDIQSFSDILLLDLDPMVQKAFIHKD